jgi:hypothetical protein
VTRIVSSTAGPWNTSRSGIMGRPRCRALRCPSQSPPLAAGREQHQATPSCVPWAMQVARTAARGIP